MTGVPPEAVRRASAYAPGHVTGVFLPRTDARDPRARGSVGAGLVLDAGAVARVQWNPGARLRVRTFGDGRSPLAISSEVAERLFSERHGSVIVRIEHELPIGQGFGMSAAGATATALAAARLTDTSRHRAVTVAHLAELFGGGGLGGVTAILGGGFEVRVAPGIPPFGRVLRRPCHDRILVGVVARPIPSPGVLRNPRALARIRRAARGFDELRTQPTLERFWEVSERFTDSAGLAPRSLSDVLRALRRRGARACQAMFGGSFFASAPRGARREELLSWMRRRDLRAVELPISSVGAHLVPLRP